MQIQLKFHSHCRSLIMVVASFCQSKTLSALAHTHTHINIFLSNNFNIHKSFYAQNKQLQKIKIWNETK